MNRRTYLTGVCTAAVAGLAGCSGSDSSGNEGSEGGSGESDQLVEIQSSELDTNEDGNVVISGEAENTADEQLVGATVVAELYDADGNSLVGEDEVQPEGTIGEDGTVPAGETAEFEIITAQQSMDEIDDYELSVGDATQTMAA